MLCLTSRLSSLRWRSCWGPRLCRGTARCLRECAAGGRSPARTEFPKEEKEKTQWLLVSMEEGWWKMTGFHGWEWTDHWRLWWLLMKTRGRAVPSLDPCWISSCPWRSVCFSGMFYCDTETWMQRSHKVTPLIYPEQHWKEQTVKHLNVKHNNILYL